MAGKTRPTRSEVLQLEEVSASDHHDAAAD